MKKRHGPFINRLQTAWNHFRQSWKLHPFLYLFDIAFIIASISSFMFLMLRATEKVREMTEAALAEIQKLQTDIRPELASPEMFNQVMGTNPAISRLFSEIILTFFLIIVLLYVFWTVFQGVNWLISAIHMKKVKSYWRYFMRFSLINLFWLMLLFIVGYVWFNLTFYNMKALIPVINQSLLNVIAIFLAGKIAYFAVISFILAQDHPSWKSVKRSFTHGARYVADFLVMFVWIIGMIAFSFLISYFLYPLSPLLSLVVLGFTFIPTLTFIRFYVGVTVADVIRE